MYVFTNFLICFQAESTIPILISCFFANLIHGFLKRFRSNVRFLSAKGYIVYPRILAEPFCHVVPAVRKRRQKSAVLLRRFLSGKVCFRLIPFFLRQHLIADHALHRYFPFNCADIRNRGRDFFIHILPHADRRNRDHIRRLGIGCDPQAAPKAFPSRQMLAPVSETKKKPFFPLAFTEISRIPPTSLYGILTIFSPFGFRISAPRQALCFAYHGTIRFPHARHCP